MQTCYACQNIATTREHVPPKCLFPKQKDVTGDVDLRRNLITVPSCEEHNLCKSEDDEYFLYVISMNLPANAIAQAHWSTKLKRAFERRPTLINSMLSNSEDVNVMDRHTGRIYEAVRVDLNGSCFNKTLELIALGVYYHHIGERWVGNIRVHPDFIDFPHESNAADIVTNRRVLFDVAKKLFASAPQYGDNPKIFWYQVHKQPAGDHLRCLIRLGFYEGCTVTVFFGEINGYR